MKTPRRTSMWLSACVLFLSLGTSGAISQQANGTENTQPKTLKERMASKASDPQRVNDCKVPLEKRGDSTRPSDCDHIKPMPDQPAAE